MGSIDKAGSMDRIETPKTPWKILIVEDHKLTNECLKLGLEKYPELTVVGQAMDAPTAFKLAQQTRPDLILMDVCLAEGNGIQLTETIKKELPETKVIMTTSMVDKKVVRAAFSVHADGYCTKETELSQLVQTIHTVMQGTVCIDPKVVAAMVRDTGDAALEESFAMGIDYRHETFSNSHASASPLAARAKSIPVFSEAPVFDAAEHQKQGSFQKVSFSQQPGGQAENKKRLNVPFSEDPTHAMQSRPIPKQNHQSYESQVGQALSGEQQHVADALKEVSTGGKVVEQLNQREMEILKLMALSYTNDRISNKLGLSSAWLSGYIKNILIKLNVQNEIQAVQRAVAEGFIHDAPLLYQEQ
ncbi:MAG: response regulator transcription factor [Vampirovibrionales bacterium]|nr:response regulator transcription factor [Vampirovibrionales bacterium]